VSQTGAFDAMTRADMRVLKLGGKFVCGACARPFDRDPKEQRREERLAELRAIPDDDEAARKFYYFRQNEQMFSGLEERWTGHHGMYSPKWGSVTDRGIEIRVSPDANVEEVMRDIDNQFLPGLRESVLHQLDGTAARWLVTLSEMPAEQETPARIERDPIPISSLYPFGYVRQDDGTVLTVEGCEAGPHDTP